MPTSTFAKQFVVKPEKANEFVEEMTKKASPTLTKDFSSRLHHEKDLKESLRKALRQFYYNDPINIKNPVLAIPNLQLINHRMTDI